MKRKFFVVALIAGAMFFQSCDKAENEPAYKSAFSTMYPDATDVTWTTQGGYNVATFKSGSETVVVWLDDDGDWYMTDTDIPYTALPQAVRTAFEASEWATWTIDDVEEVTRLDMQIVYVIEVENEATGEEVELRYLPDGTLIGAVIDNDNDDDDNSDMLPTDLPEAITNFINTQYPGAIIVDRDNDDGMIEIDILHEGLIKELTFTGAGVWVETVTEFEDNNIPTFVTETLAATEYASYEIDDVELVENSQEEYYVVEMEMGDHELTLKIMLDGTFIILEEDND